MTVSALGLLAACPWACVSAELFASITQKSMVSAYSWYLVQRSRSSSFKAASAGVARHTPAGMNWHLRGKAVTFKLAVDEAAFDHVFGGTGEQYEVKGSGANKSKKLRVIKLDQEGALSVFGKVRSSAGVVVGGAGSLWHCR